MTSLKFFYRTVSNFNILKTMTLLGWGAKRFWLVLYVYIYITDMVTSLFLSLHAHTKCLFQSSAFWWLAFQNSVAVCEQGGGPGLSFHIPFFRPFRINHMVGGGDSSVVRAPDSWLKGRGFESLLERRENFLLQGRLSVLTLISVSVPPPCYHSST